MKITKVEHIGKQNTFSPEIAGPQHNYIIDGIVHKNSHAISYCLHAYRSLWLKCYYPHEWWATVLGHCDNDKLEEYTAAARKDGVKLGNYNIGHLTLKPTAHSGKNAINGQNQVSLGLINLKGVGNSASSFTDESTKSYKDIDDFVSSKPKSRVIMERLIKLGAFSHLHKNIKGTWMWYLHTYGSSAINWDEELHDFIDGKFTSKIVRGKITTTALRNHHKALLLLKDGWTDGKVASERVREIEKYRELYPKRSKIPKKVTNWEPNPHDTRDRVMSLYDGSDYDLRNILDFEREYLGFYWHSVIDLYRTDSKCTIANARNNGNVSKVDVVITKIDYIQTKKMIDLGMGRMARVVINDGNEDSFVFIFSDDLNRICHDKDCYLYKDAGVSMRVIYNEERSCFNFISGSQVLPLITKRQWDEMCNQS